ncbi:CopG family antitoxin [Deinococcus koreensis]|uniref:Uncharacterized protein n=1 Tax=Deinococcus koreensis TaxID=2054903 RepID=A0A2K3UXK2_9DEIO|nr:CopG family antitoxin [Deinococcus koreensis]PNY81272.1 hypothetical protein CVO96_07615 [Deinococcus koreensis]
MTTLILINDPSDIPTFASEAEEAEFWATHELGDGLFDLAARNPEAADLLARLPKRSRHAGRQSKSTSLRLSADLERRLRHLAEVKGTSYQTLLKEFVLERVYEEEKRLKIV